MVADTPTSGTSSWHRQANEQQQISPEGALDVLHSLTEAFEGVDGMFLLAGDVVRVPFADVPYAAIDPADIAAVAVRALVDDGHVGRTYELTGPRALLPADQVAVLAEALGRELRCEALTPAQARTEMEATMSEEYVDAFFRFFVDGTLDESTIYPTVEEVTGCPARTFEEWTSAHISAFGGRGRGHLLTGNSAYSIRAYSAGSELAGVELATRCDRS
ncbi:hypothetical protein ACIBEK_02925 [Nocardia fusca]|uniref:hypothetical protein n=1 Tax=Nocardia fusca TaxID=941183 RepID=UPI0037B5B38A